MIILFEKPFQVEKQNDKKSMIIKISVAINYPFYIQLQSTIKIIKIINPRIIFDRVSKTSNRMYRRKQIFLETEKVRLAEKLRRILLD